MRKIDLVTVNQTDFVFYDGIDFEFIDSELTGQFHVFFVECWDSEVLRWRRDRNIESLVSGKESLPVPEAMSKRNVAVYATGGQLDRVYMKVREKILKGQITPFR